MMKDKSYLKKLLNTNILWHLILLIFVIFSLMPIIWMISTAFKTPQEIFGTELSIIPSNPTLNSFIKLEQGFNIVQIILNTFIVAILLTLSRTFTGLLAAYGFARFDFPFKKLLFFLCIVTLFIPIQVVMISNYLIISKLGLVNNFLGVVLPQFAHAFAFFLLYQHLIVFPEEIIEAASIDGAGRITILFKIVIPCIRPALIAVTIIMFINSWNQYVWPSIILRKPEYMTLPIWLRHFMHAEAGLDWGLLMAASLIGVFPVLLLYIFAHRKIISTFIGSGTKG